MWSLLWIAGSLIAQTYLRVFGKFGCWAFGHLFMMIDEDKEEVPVSS